MRQRETAPHLNFLAIGTAVEPVLRSADEWLALEKYRHIVVLDPDGWDRKNFETSWAERIDEATFNARIMVSTCQIRRR